MNQTLCAYCKKRIATTKDHVFPKGLYPTSKAKSKVQRLKVPACRPCNNSFSDDEAHFRSVLDLAGPTPNKIRQELWETKIIPSLDKIDGPRRLKDLINILKSVEINGKQRHKIYPGKDPKTTRVIKKIIRGLSYHHGISSYIPETNIWADTLQYKIPEEFLSIMNYAHREQDIAEYRYGFFEEIDFRSAWLITFFKTVTFIGLVFDSEVSKKQLLGH